MTLKSEMIDVSLQFNFLGFLYERFHTLDVLNQPCVEAWAMNRIIVFHWFEYISVALCT